MSTRPEMTLRTIEPAQYTAAKIAGFMYLFNFVVAVFGQLTPSWIEGSGDFPETTRRILASEHLYRVALTSVTIGWVSIVILAFALYVTLEPVNKRLAQLALLFRLGESFVGAVTVVLSFATLRLYTAVQAVGPFQNHQLQALVSITRSAGGSGFNIAMTFFSLGSLLFFYLFYKSRYIPRALAALGVFGSVMMVMVSLAILILPEYTRTFHYGWASIGIAEITTAFWLMIRGIQPAPMREMSAASA